MGKRISPTDALRLMRAEGYLYLDVRSVLEFELGHPVGAYNLPWQLDAAPGSEPNPEFVALARSLFTPNTKLIVGCRTNNRSALAAAALRDAGFSHVYEQRAGVAGLRDAFGGPLERGWEALGLPMATQTPAGHSYAALEERAREPQTSAQ